MLRTMIFMSGARRLVEEGRKVGCGWLVASRTKGAQARGGGPQQSSALDLNSHLLCPSPPSNVLPTPSSSDWCSLLPLFMQLERLSSYTLHMSATVLQGPHFSRHSSLSSSPGRTPYGQLLSPAAALRCTIM